YGCYFRGPRVDRRSLTVAALISSLRLLQPADPMIRAFFLACGTFITLCGGSLLLVDRVVLTDDAARHLRDSSGSLVEASIDDAAANNGRPPWRFVSQDVIDPPDWGAFGLLSIGGVTLLYTFALPGRRDDDDEEDGSAPFLRQR
ncbi:MAG: hypothetical protein WBC44_07220, partial [Planctomycetaceae bacterium]